MELLFVEQADPLFVGCFHFCSVQSAAQAVVDGNQVQGNPNRPPDRPSDHVYVGRIKSFGAGGSVSKLRLTFLK